VVRADDAVLAASEVRRLEEGVRELEQLLGCKILEVEIFKEALDLARAKKADIAVALAAAGRYPVKTVSTTLGVARSNIIDHRERAQTAGAGRRNAPAMLNSPARDP
jgi:transposase